MTYLLCSLSVPDGATTPEEKKSISSDSSRCVWKNCSSGCISGGRLGVSRNLVEVVHSKVSWLLDSSIPLPPSPLSANSDNEDLALSLLAAARKGESKVVRCFLERNVGIVMEELPNGYNVFSLAVKQGSVSGK